MRRAFFFALCVIKCEKARGNVERKTSGEAESGKNPWNIMAEAERLNAVRRRVQDTEKHNLSAEQHQETLNAVTGTELRYGRPLTDSEMLAVIKSESEFYGVARKLDANGYPVNAAGKVFEKGITELMIQQFGYTEKKDGVFSVRERDMSTRGANIVEDVLEGADIMLMGMPVDITLNPEKGGKIGSVDADGKITEGYATIGDIDGVTIKSGFRMTNGRHNLPMPVCVMLFEGSRERLNASDIVDKMHSNSQAFTKLTDDAMSAYWDYSDAVDAA
jgi:hypothetical protein